MRIYRMSHVAMIKQSGLTTFTAIASVLLLLPSMPLHAANWTEFRGKSVEGVTVFVDERSVEIEHDTLVKGWVKFEYAKPKLNQGAEAMSRMTSRVVNCDTRRYWVIEDMLTVRHSVDPVHLEVSNGQQQWQIPVPGTESEMALDALCYQTRSAFGKLLDSVEDVYEVPSAVGVGKVSPEELSALGVNPSAQDVRLKAWVGETATNAGSVSLYSNHIFLAKDTLYFVGWDNAAQKFSKVRELPLDQVNSASMVHGGTYEQLRQIHLVTDSGLTVISFSKGENDAAENFFTQLAKAGLDTNVSSKYIHGYRVDSVIVPVTDNQ